jgi:hypothetical protein
VSRGARGRREGGKEEKRENGRGRGKGRESGGLDPDGGREGTAGQDWRGREEEIDASKDG